MTTEMRSGNYPLERPEPLPQPEEVAKLPLFLASDDARTIHNAVIRVATGPEPIAVDERQPGEEQCAVSPLAGERSSRRASGPRGDWLPDPNQNLTISSSPLHNSPLYCGGLGSGTIPVPQQLAVSSAVGRRVVATPPGKSRSQQQERSES